MIELHPCPRCGGQGAWEFSGKETRYGEKKQLSRWGRIVCDTCGARTHEKQFKPGAVNAWNSGNVFYPHENAKKICRPRQSLIGRQYDDLTVIGAAEPYCAASDRQQWICKCKCGGTITYSGYYLRTAKVKLDCGVCSGRTITRKRQQPTKYVNLDGVFVEPCPFNKNVLCGTGDCEKCGWNPAVARYRSLRARLTP